MRVRYRPSPRGVLLLATVVLLGLCVSVNQAADTKTQAHEKLTAKDRQLLEGLFKEFLFDPEGAKRVRVKTTLRNAWAQVVPVQLEGWLVAGKGDSPARVHFIDKEASAPVGPKSEIEEIDFVAKATAELAKQPKKKKDDPWDDDTFRQMALDALGLFDLPNVVRAAWLHRLGHDDLAASALRRARAEAKLRAKAEAEADGEAKTKEAAEDRDRKMVTFVREDLAWQAFSTMVHAYMVRADEEAMTAGERLFRLYSDEAKEYPQAAAILEELRRRKKEGTFGKSLRRWCPPEEWPTPKKVAHLIKALEDVDVVQMGQPGHVIFAMDVRVSALIDIGDAAVPALIDTIENDTRLTRSVHVWRDFDRSRTVLGVREAALEAVMPILRTRVFNIRFTGDDFTSRGEAKAKEVAGTLRAYWNKYGRLPFDERMMAILTDPEASPEMIREAAYNLAHLGERRLLAGAGSSGRTKDRRDSPNPAVSKFKNPTAAEAILAALDRDMKDLDAQPREVLYYYSRRKTEDQYLDALVYLGDRQITEELTRRFRSAKTLRDRRNWAATAQRLGNGEAMKEFAADIENGELKLPARRSDRRGYSSDQPPNVELSATIRELARAGTPEADRALYALTDPEHPYYTLLRGRLFEESTRWGDESWFVHPYCLKLLRRELDNEESTWREEKIGDPTPSQKDGDDESGMGMSVDPQFPKAQAEEPACDRAAAKLLALTLGLPWKYLPQESIDASLDYARPENTEANLALLKKAFDGYRQGFRRATALEIESLELFGQDVLYIPDIRPLDHPATAEDVRAGRAIFHLDGKGKLAKQRLPAVATPKTVEKKDHLTRNVQPMPVLVVQAEIDADGNTFYGIIGEGPARKVKAEDLADVKPIQKPFSLLDLLP